MMPDLAPTHQGEEILGTIRTDTARQKKREEGQQRENYIQIILSLNRITDEQAASRDQADRNEGKKSLRDWLTIIALFSAAAAALITVLVSHGDTRRALKDARYATNRQLAASTDQLNEMIAQVQAMRDQLAEAKRQRAITIAQTRANILRTDISVTPINDRGTFAATGDKITSWAISPVYANAGPTDAEDYRAWFEIKTFIITSPHKVTASECPTSILPKSINGGVFQRNAKITESAKFVSATDILNVTQGGAYILMWGHLEYKDIYYLETPFHYEDWCVVVVPNDPGLFNALVFGGIAMTESGMQQVLAK
jgi:hypothetical protein